MCIDVNENSLSHWLQHIPIFVKACFLSYHKWVELNCSCRTAISCWYSLINLCVWWTPVSGSLCLISVQFGPLLRFLLQLLKSVPLWLRFRLEWNPCSVGRKFCGFYYYYLFFSSHNSVRELALVKQQHFLIVHQKCWPYKSCAMEYSKHSGFIK